MPAAHSPPPHEGFNHEDGTGAGVATPGGATARARLRDAAAAAAALAAGRLSRTMRAGGGSSLPGVLVESLSPGFIARRAARLADGVVAVSGTNGKTTTASMIRVILRQEGLSTVGNESGANLKRGIATALVDARSNATVGVFEVDEAALVSLMPALRPRLVVLTNMFRDQLDRFGEVERVAELLRGACERLPDDGYVIANVDDPLLWHTVEGFRRIGFGVRRPSVSPTSGAGSPGIDPGAEPTPCPRCGAPLNYEERTIGHLGVVRCTRCSMRSATPDYEARVLIRDGLRSIVLDVAGVPLTLSTGGLHNAYNAAAAIAAAGVLGISPTRSVTALESFRPRFGRAEELQANGRPVWLALMKNPAAAAALIPEIAEDPRVGAVVVSVNDLVADGRDISWIWDVDFERLATAGVPLIPSGTRAPDVAVRLKYAGADPLPASRAPADAIRAATDACPPGKQAVVMATYTAMLDIRRAFLGDRAVRLLDVRS
ncbi:MAG: DUF1727 domain-containing protein [Actinobacteria bacterium]|nr:DUF1727 domain-containing protein [Actinomycetota bacterium]